MEGVHVSQLWMVSSLFCSPCVPLTRHSNSCWIAQRGTLPSSSPNEVPFYRSLFYTLAIHSWNTSAHTLIGSEWSIKKIPEQLKAGHSHSRDWLIEELNQICDIGSNAPVRAEIQCIYAGCQLALILSVINCILIQTAYSWFWLHCQHAGSIYLRWISSCHCQ